MWKISPFLNTIFFHNFDLIENSNGRNRNQKYFQLKSNICNEMLFTWIKKKTILWSYLNWNAFSITPLEQTRCFFNHKYFGLISISFLFFSHSNLKMVLLHQGSKRSHWHIKLSDSTQRWGGANSIMKDLHKDLTKQMEDDKRKNHNRLKCHYQENILGVRASKITLNTRRAVLVNVTSLFLIFSSLFLHLFYQQQRKAILTEEG